MKEFLINEKISILIPVYNEEKTIEEILNRVLKETEGWEKEIIVINDGSNDGTLKILEKFLGKIILIKLKRNRGKGFALREGFKRAKGKIIITQDADLEYDPKDYQKLLTPILEGKTKVVYGSRNLNPANRPSSKTYLYGGKLITAIFNFLFKTKLTDINTGYKVFEKDILEDISLKENGFSFCEEFTAQVIKNNLSILEVPISYQGRSFFEGKKLRWYHGLRSIWIIFTQYFSKNV